MRTCSYASSRRRAFLGDRKRWAISCQLAYSSAGMRTARPLLETISTTWWLATTRPMRAGSVRLASSAPPAYSTSRGPLMWRVSASKRRLTREAVESSMRPAKRRPCTRSRRCSMTASRRALS